MISDVAKRAVDCDPAQAELYYLARQACQKLSEEMCRFEVIEGERETFRDALLEIALADDDRPDKRQLADFLRSHAEAALTKEGVRLH